MRSNVRICDVSGIDLASHHKRSAPDPKSFLLIAFKKYCKCLLRNASHRPLALIQFCRVRFEFSHGCMIWLPGFGKSWIAQFDATDIRELRECAVCVRSTTAAQADFTRNPSAAV